RREIRDLLGRGRLEELAKRARSADLRGQPAATLALLGSMLGSAKRWQDAERVLRLGQQTHPGDFWLNHELGMCLREVKPPKHEDAVRFLTVAVALRSLSPGTHLNLGNALSRQGRPKEAEQAYRDAIKLKPAFAEAHVGLGNALSDQGRHKEAEQA